jgi:hypothetical protein
MRRLKLDPGIRLGCGGKPLGAKTTLRIEPGGKSLRKSCVGSPVIR